MVRNSGGSAKTVVVTRTKNRALLLKRALQSVLSQTDGDFLHVIVNDGGCRKEIEELLDEHRDVYGDRILLIHNDKSIGMEAASNLALKSSKSSFVVIHDDDDSWDPRFLERMTEFLQNERDINNLGGVICYTTEVREKITGNVVKECGRRSMVSLPDRPSLWRMCAGNLFSPISFLFRRDVFDVIGFYREDLPVQGDWDFNIRFMAHFEIALVRQHLAFYHVRESTDRTPEEYSNSVSKRDRHQFFNNYLRNEFLRQDLAEGKLGIGYMMNVNPILIRLDGISLRLLNTWERLKPHTLFGGVRKLLRG